MSTFRNPVGPQPSKVYWRRRLVVLLGALAVIVAIVLIVVRPGANADGAASPTKTPADTSQTDAATPKPTSSSTAKPAADGTAAACATGAVKVVPVTDASSYGAEGAPMLSLKLTNTGDAACTMSVGSDVQKYTITSGKDLIWTSTDCQTKPEKTTATLEPGKTVTRTPFAWDRTRSDPKTCNDDRDQVAADGASYHLDVTVDKVASTDSKQFILK